jgi:XTP/dITP diphosphohydrolase
VSPAALRLPARLVLATGNRGKLAEVRAILGARGVEVAAAIDVAPGWSLVEDGETFEANARKKAVDLAERTGAPALGDDSGLEVEALGGRPGVRSARYAGEHATDAENVARLLAEMEAVPDARRAAAFRCVMVLAWPDGRTAIGEGRCAGTIAGVARGQGGFGYDPVFVDPATGRTFAELSAEEKNARSHRRRALDALCAGLGSAAGGAGFGDQT